MLPINISAVGHCFPAGRIRVLVRAKVLERGPRPVNRTELALFSSSAEEAWAGSGNMIAPIPGQEHEAFKLGLKHTSACSRRPSPGGIGLQVAGGSGGWRLGRLFRFLSFIALRIRDCRGITRARGAEIPARPRFDRGSVLAVVPGLLANAVRAPRLRQPL